MLWAALVAGGVAIVSMAVFAARLTRREHEEDLPFEVDGSSDPAPDLDPDDPWSAWRPRPFEELDRPPRPRLWPVMASLTGLVLVGGGLAGARQTFSQPEVRAAAESGGEPFLIEVRVTPTPSPTPAATPSPAPATPRPQATAAPRAAAPAPAAAAPGGPSITGSASCAEGKAKVNFVVTSQGAQISWVGIYLDGEVTGGGPVSSTRYEAGIERTASPGPHDIEVSAQDDAGKTARRQWRVNCA